MALQIIVKNSSVSGNEPTAGQLANGELALNYHANGPFITCKDTAGVVRRVTGVWVNATAPSSPTPGELWLDISVTPAQLKVYKDVGDAWVAAITVYAATTSIAGVIELATDAETQTGSETNRAVTPASLQSKLSDSTSTTSNITIASSTAVKAAYDLANAALPKTGGTVTGNLEIGTAGSLSFEGATADGFETTIAITDPTADRTITLPNTTGTVVTTGDTGTVTSTMLLDGTIVDADINASAEIAVSKLADGSARQLLQTDAAGTGVEWASNIDIPGTLDVTSAATFDSTVTIAGDLTVNGTTTNINTVNLTVEDKNIIIADVATPSDVTADGGGITLKGATDKTINWIDATDAWTLSEHVNIASAKEYRIAGTKVLDATSLGSAVVSSSLTSVGTIGTGVWQGTAIADTYLGTISTALKVSNSATTATSANTASAIVARDASGNFTAGTITAALTGAASNNVLKAGDTMTGALVVPLASASTPSLTFTGDLNTGIYSPGADQVAVATNGVERVEFGASEVVFNDGNNDYDFRVESDNNASLLFVDASTDRFGIGHSSPATLIHVADTLAGSPVIARIENFSASANSDAALDLKTPNETYTFKALRSSARLDLETGGTPKLSITSAGLVGIGTSSPGSSLHVNTASGDCKQTISASAGTTSAFTAFVNTTITTVGTENSAGGNLVAGSSAYATILSNSGAYPIQFGTNNTIRATLDSSGRLGIGTTSPTSPLHVKSTGNGSSFASSLELSDNSVNVNTLVIQQATGITRFLATWNGTGVDTNLTFWTTNSSGSQSERVRIDTNGRLLVGTSSAQGQSIFQAVGSSSASTEPGDIRVIRGLSVSSIGANVDAELGIIKFGALENSVCAQISAVCDANWSASDTPGRLVFSTTADGASSPTERFRIASTGRATFDLNNAGFYLLGLGSAAGTNALRWSSSTGLVTADTSSRLVKENIVDCPYGIDTIKALQPRKYFRIDDQRNEIGFVADEMTSVLPELVPYGPKSVLTNDPDDTENIPIGVNYEKLTAVLTKALQETIAKIETLEAKVAALESA